MKARKTKKRKSSAVGVKQIDIPEFEHLWTTEGIFSEHYIRSRLKHSTLWPKTQDIEAIYDFCVDLWQNQYSRLLQSSEAVLRQEFLDKILTRLGFSFLPNVGLPGGRRRREPDYVLFSNDSVKDSVLGQGKSDKYAAAISLLETKKADYPLDSASERELSGRFPHQQIRDYLQEATDVHGTAFFNWAILTNGSKWRLYCRSAHPASFFEINFRVAISSLENFKMFAALFRPAALERYAANKCSLDDLRTESLAFRIALEGDLRKRIFNILESLANGFHAFEDNNIEKNDLPELYENCLIYLYRLLFVLYAESRGLLPVSARGASSSKGYRERYSLQKLVHRLKNPLEFPSDDFTDLYEDLLKLFHLINGNRPSLNRACGVPLYDGRLFDNSKYPKLDQWLVGGKTLANVLRGLMFNNIPPKFGEQHSIDFGETIDYADLEVRQLGSIYEGLLEHHLELHGKRLQLVVDKKDRKATGTYYTPDYVVQHIVESTLDPIVEAVNHLPQVQNSIKRKKKDDSFAEEILKLHILDPALGSGHFLVRATEFLSDAIFNHPTTALLHGDERIDSSAERAEIKFWRRRVIESCMYGVDINPLAVELAKLSLWLTGISPDQPLDFLDHHLSTGNSLIGMKLTDLSVLPSMKDKQQRSIPFGRNLQKCIMQAIETLKQIRDTVAIDISDVKTKEKKWQKNVRQQLRPYRLVADLWSLIFYDSGIGESDFIVASEIVTRLGEKSKGRVSRNLTKFQPALDKARSHRFFHWELEFPEVFFNDDGTLKQDPGFDVIIGNPPYGAELTDSEREYLYQRYGLHSTDTACLFMGLARELLNANGFNGFIVPKSFVYSSTWAATRQKLLAGITEIADCGKVWKNVKLEQIIYVYHKRQDHDSYRSKLKKDQFFKDLGRIDKNTYSEFGFLLNGISERELEIGRRVKNIGTFLKGYIRNQRGAPLQRSVTQSPGSICVIGGKQILPYAISGDLKGYMSSDTAVDEKAVMKSDSILAQNIVAHIQNPAPHIKIIASIPYGLDLSRYVILDTVNQLQNTSHYSSFFLLAIINSKLISWYVYNFIFGRAIRTMHFDNYVTDRIPIPQLDLRNVDQRKKYDMIISLAEELVKSKAKLIMDKGEISVEKLKSKFTDIERSINTAVYNMYELSKEDIHIVENKLLL